MKVLCLLALLLCLAGCGSITEIHSNMQQSNANMEANIVVLQDVRETVLENSAGVVRSTEEVRHFQKINGENIKVATNLIRAVERFDIHRLAILGLFLLLVLPCIILATYYFKLPRKEKK